MKLIGNHKFLLSMLFLGILIACTQPTKQTPKQIAEEALYSATVRLEAKDTDGDLLGYGSGFFVTRDQIVTHINVVAGAASVEAELVYKGKKFAIEGVTAFDRENNLVILKVVGKGSKPLSLDNSDNIQGSGYILGYDEYSKTTFDGPWLPPLPPETMGGPVLNSQGKVVRVVDITGSFGSTFINAKVVEKLLKKHKSFKKSELLSAWQKRKPILPIATEQLAKKKGRRATVRLIRADDIEEIQLGNGLIRRTSKGLGSGFFIAPDKIVTNIHCVADATKIQAKMFGTETLYNIKGVAAFDPKKDLVILKVAQKAPKFLSLGDSDAAQIGELIAAVGNPQTDDPISETIAEALGMENVEEGKITNGSIHSIRKSDKLIRLTAKLLPGNSGGPVLNSNGKVIGIAVGGTISSAFGYAIPSNALEELFKNSEPTQFLELEQWQQKSSIRAYAYHSHSQVMITNALEIKDTQHALYKKAIEYLNEAIKLYPGYIQSFYLRGVAKTELGQYQKAIDDFDKFIKLIPDGAFAYTTRGQAKQHLGDFDEAIADFSVVIELMPDDANAYNNRGVAYYLCAKEQEKVEGKSEIVKILYQVAIEDYKKTLAVKPGHVKASNNLKLTKEALKQLEK